MRGRLLLACGVAVACALFTWYQHTYLLAHGSPPDSLYLWRAANALLGGANPWVGQALNTFPRELTGRAVEARVHLFDPLFYPMPAVLLWVPLARLDYLHASTLFNAVAAFAFTFAITRDGLYRAWACGSVPFIIAMRFGQWSPLIVAAWVYPWLGVLLVAKPNIGLPVFAARPGRIAAAACTLALLLPTLLAPWWVRDWLRNLQADMGRSAPHPAPITMFGGAGLVLLVALLRWRRPEARLVAFLACLPQLPFWADQLPLLVVPRGRREMQAMMLATLTGFLCWSVLRGGEHVIDSMRPFAIIFTYLPAVALVLRRPNIGDLPTWLEVGARRLPLFLRGETIESPRA